MSDEPYLDLELSDGRIHRYFLENVDEMELVWHRDERDRTVTVLKSDGWLFQFDNKMPFVINNGDVIHIPAMEYHRVIKGNGPLEIMIDQH